MNALDDWHGFFATMAGASASLVGLLIVAMSVNIAQVIQIRSMPSRAAATIGSLVLVVVTGLAVLVPKQPFALLGAEIVVLTLIAAALTIDSIARILTNRQDARIVGGVAKSILGIAQIIPFLIGGLLITAESDAGLYLVAAGAIIVIIASVVNAWVLLVEIRR